MGLEPVTTIACLGIIAIGAVAAVLQGSAREEERRRRCEEESRRWRREEKKREKEAKKKEKERARQREREEQARREEREWELIRRQERDDERRTRDILSNNIYQTERTLDYYQSKPYYNPYERDRFFNPYVRYSTEENPNCDLETASLRSNNLCNCFRCQRDNFDTLFSNNKPASSRTENSCECRRCRSKPTFNPFESRKNSVSVIFTSPQTTQNNNSNAQRSNDRRSSSSQSAKTSKSTENQNTNSTKYTVTSGSQQPQRNNNNNNNNKNNNNNSNIKVQDYGKLNDFIKILQTVLDRCNASTELRKKILSFFNNFQRHEENFLRILETHRINRIGIEDILFIVIRLFQSEYFANDVAYENFFALIEIVGKYIRDELLSEIVANSLRGNKASLEKQREECMKKVLKRNNILTEIINLFDAARNEIVEDIKNQPYEPDFSGIFAKVYHYLKHRDFRNKSLSVTEYFDLARKLLTMLKCLNPEYAELTNVNHSRREIVFEVYTTVFRGRFRIVVRAYGPRLYICTFFLNEKYDKKAKDGDKYVDGKKKP